MSHESIDKNALKDNTPEEILEHNLFLYAQTFKEKIIPKMAKDFGVNVPKDSDIENLMLISFISGWNRAVDNCKEIGRLTLEEMMESFQEDSEDDGLH